MAATRKDLLEVTASLAEEFLNQNSKKKITTSKKHADAYTKAFVEAIRMSLIEGEDVDLTNLTSFKLIPVEAHEGRNPQTGEKIQVPDKLRVRTKVSKKLVDEVNGN